MVAWLIAMLVTATAVAQSRTITPDDVARAVQARHDRIGLLGPDDGDRHVRPQVLLGRGSGRGDEAGNENCQCAHWQDSPGFPPL